MKSAIEDIINGKRGKLDQIKMSEKYFADLSAAIETEKQLLEKMKDFSELLDLYREASESEGLAHASEVHDVYK